MKSKVFLINLLILWVLFGVVQKADAAEVDHFIFTGLGASEEAGEPFSITITAVDTASQKVTSFTGTVDLTVNTDYDGVVSPATTENFDSGVWTGNVSLDKIATDIYLTCDDGAGHTANSSIFDVTPGAATTLVFDQIGPQISGEDFSI
ncbi:hypothetical protein KJ654_04640, partial [Patescibacteria group bacterium]|nr:hypothetical protein [Patescibacteria group bacterium]